MTQFPPAPTDLIKYEHFAALDIRVAIVQAAALIEGADRLLKLTLDVGSVESGGLGIRVVASGIRQWYQPEELVGTPVIYLANLEPRLLRGVESQGMILAAGEELPALLQPNQPIAAGSRVH